ASGRTRAKNVIGIGVAGKVVGVCQGAGRGVGHDAACSGGQTAKVGIEAIYVVIIRRVNLPAFACAERTTRGAVFVVSRQRVQLFKQPEADIVSACAERKT